MQTGGFGMISKYSRFHISTIIPNRDGSKITPLIVNNVEEMQNIVQNTKCQCGKELLSQKPCLILGNEQYFNLPDEPCILSQITALCQSCIKSKAFYFAEIR
jgi:hypothetical protein